MHNAKKVVDAALFFILTEFIDFATRDDFDKLTYPDVLHIIQDDRLFVNYEESVIEAVMKWGQSNKDRQQDLGNLIAQSYPISLIIFILDLGPSYTDKLLEFRWVQIAHLS